MILVTPTELQVFTALQSFLQSVLPSGTSVIRGQANRTPEPAAPDYVEMTPLFMPRLSTNLDDYADCGLTGSISDTTLTVTAVQFGSIVVGAPVYGAADGTAVTALGTGSGGTGTYTVAPSQTLASTQLYAGVKTALQSTQATVQIDVHGLPAGNAANNTNLITTLWRDDYGVQFFVDAGIAVAPLYASDPRQLAFMNGEDQYEDRWSFDLVMQVNFTAQLPQQFADQLTATAIAVESLA